MRMLHRSFGKIGKRFVFRRFVLSYFTVAFALVMLLMMCTLVLSVRQYQMEWEHSNMLKLRQISELLDQQFKTFLSIGAQINNNPNFLVKNISDDYPSFNAVKDLKLYANFSSFPFDFLLIYNSDQVQHVYSSDGAMNIAHYDRCYNIDAFSLEDIQNMMNFSKDIQLVKTKKNHYAYIINKDVLESRPRRDVFVCAIPSSITGYNVPAILLFLIEPQKIADMFDDLFADMNYSPFISTDNGTMYILGNGAPDGKYTTLTFSSGTFPWTYGVDLAPNDFFHSWTFYAYVLVFLAAALLALTASYFLALRNYVPIQSILNCLQSQGPQFDDNEDEFAYINGVLETLSVHEDTLAVPDTLKTLLSADLTANNLSEVHDALRLPHAPCAFMLVMFHNITQSVREEDLSAQLRLLPDAPVVLTAKLDFSQEILALLVWKNAPVRRNIVHELEMLHQRHAAADPAASVVVSPFFDELNQVQRHFYQMQYVVRYQFTPGHLFLDIELLSVMEKTYIDMNYHSHCHDLYSQLIIGDVKLAEATFHKVLNYMNAADSSCNIGIFYMTLLSVFQQVNEKVLLNEELRQMISELLSVGDSAQRDVGRSLEHCMQRIVELMESQKSPLQSEAVRAFVESCYRSPDFSLQLLADTFNVSSPTMSRFFKSEIGKGLAEYVTDRRMEDAKSLLKETDLPVKEIAKEVGYSDVNTFIRRFKAKTGSTPTEFRTF